MSSEKISQKERRINGKDAIKKEENNVKKSTKSSSKKSKVSESEKKKKAIEEVIISDAKDNDKLESENEDIKNVFEEEKAELEHSKVKAYDKKNESKESKAMFIQRFLAFIIDIIIVSTIAAMIAFPFVDNEKTDKLNDQLDEIVEEYSKSDMTLDTYKTYLNDMIPITYDIAKNGGLVSLISLVCEILYFVVFQLYNGGQTIGKKMLKIKIISNNGGSLTMNQMICRSLIINSILLELLSFSLMLFATKTVYFYTTMILEMIQYIVTITSVFMVMCSKNGCAIHDRVARTRVIKVK